MVRSVPTWKSVVTAACLALSMAGCRSAIHASLENWQPAPAEVHNVRSLVAPKFRGDQDDRARNLVVEKIRESQFFKLAPAAPLDQQMAAASQNALVSSSTRDLVAAARVMGVDAVLLGEVHSQVDLGKDLGSIVVRIGDPRVITRVQFELVDTRTGRILVQDSVERIYEGEIKRTDRSAPTHEKIIADLTAQCALIVATKLCPHAINVSVPLAKDNFGGGAAQVRNGNDLAEQDRWGEAAEQWRQAIQENAANHAALFNLGLACEKHCDFAQARSYHEAALKISEERAYRAALQRMELAEKGLRVVQQQRARFYQPLAPRAASQLASRPPQAAPAPTLPHEVTR